MCICILSKELGKFIYEFLIFHECRFPLIASRLIYNLLFRMTLEVTLLCLGYTVMNIKNYILYHLRKSKCVYSIMQKKE